MTRLTRSACLMNARARWNSPDRARCDEVAGDGDDVELAVLNQRLDRLVLLRDGGVAEVQVGAVEDRETGAVTASR